MHYLEYYMSSKTAPLKIPCNEGIEAVPKLLQRLTMLGIPCKIVDTCQMSEKERGEIYNSVIVVSVKDSFRRREIFRGKHGKSNFFGREVPALVVYDDENKRKIIDVLPKKMGDRIITIKQSLEKFIEEAMKGVGVNAE